MGDESFAKTITDGKLRKMLECRNFATRYILAPSLSLGGSCLLSGSFLDN